jgi:hypothetical protein
MHIFPAIATSGLKFLALFLNTMFPFSSAFHPLISAKSPVIDLSNMKFFPS